MSQRSSAREHGERQRPFEERATDDRACAAHCLDGGEVGDGADPSRREDVAPETLDDLPEEDEVGPRERSVALHGRAEDPLDPGLAAAFDRLPYGELRLLRPAARDQAALAHVDCDEEPVTESRRVARKRLGRRPRSRAHDHTLRARAEERLGVGEGPDPPGCLHPGRASGRHEAPDHVGPTPPAPRPVQVDDVHGAGSGFGEPPRERARIALPYENPIERATLEAHGLLAEDVDRGHNLEAGMVVSAMIA